MSLLTLLKTKRRLNVIDLSDDHEPDDEFDDDEIYSISDPIPIPTSPQSPRRRRRVLIEPLVSPTIPAPSIGPSSQDIEDNIFFYMSMRGT